MTTLNLVVFARMFTSLTLAIIAGTLVFNSIVGWGWFLFASVWLGAITVAENKYKSKETE